MSDVFPNQASAMPVLPISANGADKTACDRRRYTLALEENLVKHLLWISAFIMACGGSGGSGSSSLLGTWDLVGATGGAPQGTLVLTSSRLTITVGSVVVALSVDGKPTFDWTDGDGPTPITATHAGAGVDFGIVPLQLGGDWTFTGAQGGSCSASVQSASLLGSCSGVGRAPAPLPSLNRHATAMRTRELGSVFGDLGGAWSVSDDHGASCNITVQGATIMASCSSHGSSAGGVSLTFGDGVVSGTTDSGVEFSARRR